MTRRKLSFLALPILAVAALIGATVLSSSASSRPKHQYAHPNLALIRAFHVLRRSATASSNAEQALPPGVFEAHEQNGTDARGMEPDLTREVRVGAKYPTWIVPDGDQLCIVQSGIVGAGVDDSVCGSAQSALEGGLIKVSGLQSGGSVVTGLVPDGNAAVRVTEADGAVRSVPVHENLFEIVGGHPASVSLTEAGGNAVSEEIPGM